MNNLKALLDGMSAQWQKDRAASQMTLGDLIDALGSLPEGAEVDAIGDAHSYRGYYSDLAFKRLGGRRKACDLLAEAKAAMGEVFRGYKGGDYMMGKQTPVWVADYGCLGQKIMGINPDGSFSLEDDE
jgi:hypothetical protein